MSISDICLEARVSSEYVWVRTVKTKSTLAGLDLADTPGNADGFSLI